MKAIRAALTAAVLAAVFVSCGKDKTDDWQERNCRAGVQIEGRVCPPPSSSLTGV